MNLILCGLHLSGKTTIGKMLAHQMECHFIDTDHLIESAYAEAHQKKYTCRQICIHEGESAFRELEKQQIGTLNEVKNSVIALGGGSLRDESTIQKLKMIGWIVYLKTPSKIIWERILMNGIPSYLDSKNPEKAFYEVIEKRLPLYEKASDMMIETNGLTKEEIRDLILKKRRGMDGQ